MASSLHSFLKKTPEWVEILAEHLPQVESLVTEDDTPVDHLLSAKQQRLLVESLYTSWTGPEDGRPFLADANVGVFSAVSQPPLVPDVFLSQVNAGWLSEVGLGVRLWRGVYEGLIETWLRWHDQAGSVIPTGAEGAK